MSGKLYTYYEPVPGISQLDSLLLICKWREAWNAIGFQPYVLNSWHSEKHPYFSEYAAAISKLPSVNAEGYERACWIRWLALAQVGGGLFGDFDVMPRPGHVLFTKSPTVAEWLTAGFEPGFDPAKLHLLQSNCVCPCLVYASADTCVRMAQEFATGQFGKRKINGRDHLSDQYALEDLVLSKADWIVQHDLVRLYGDEGWRDRPFVHFANAAATPAGKTPRWKFVQEVMS